ncbi:MAG: lactate utilization protein [Ruminococcaceae bacterium]|nr:lactate utilization protein [Oscillospiraceae bacterium]
MDFTTITKNLTDLGYTVSCFDTKKEAAEYLLNSIKGTTVGLGGTITGKEMGLYESLSKENKVAWHWYASEDAPMAEALEQAACTDVYISSVNAIAETGELVNIDGTCNRLASTLYGHKKVYFIIGKNKIAPDYDRALFRARNIAAPLNARRLNKNTPCAKGELRCYNCKSPDRICKALTVFWECPKGCEYEILLINENLGY